MPSRKSIRLIFPQWQGGVNPPYYFGAEMMAWLAPQNTEPGHVFKVPVQPPEEVGTLREEEGMMGRSEVLRNHASALEILEREAPDTVVVFGGDCAVSLVPFTYLSSRYRGKGKFGVLWIDAHPDVTANVSGFPNSHMHVLANLMGEGDAGLTAFVKDPVPSRRVLLVGVNEALPHEEAFLKEHRIKVMPTREVRPNGPQKIADWVAAEGITHLAIHFDVDVLNPRSVKSLIYTKPNAGPDYMAGVAQGTLELAEVAAILRAVEAVTDVVGLTIAEFFPWDAMRFKAAMKGFPLLRPKGSKL